MEGIISLRDEIIPVVDLAMRLELAILKSSDKWALIIEPLLTAPGNGYIRGIGKAGNRLLILLDADKMFSEEDMQEMEKVG